jgi:hypothetical protein
MSFQTKITFHILQAIKKTSYRSHALIFYVFLCSPNESDVFYVIEMMNYL